MTLEEIKNECAGMQAELEDLIPNDINAVIDHAKKIAAYHVRSGNLLAIVKKAYRTKSVSEVAEAVKKIAKDSCYAKEVQKILVNGIANDELELVDMLDRINSSCTKVLDLCRSIISKEKAEMAYLNFQK